MGLAGAAVAQTPRTKLVVHSTLEVDNIAEFKQAFEAPAGVGPRWEVALDLLARLGKPLNAGSAGEVFVEMAAEVAVYKDLTHRNLGPQGKLVGDRAKAQATA